MKPSKLSSILAKAGRKGAKVRAKRLTAKRRREIATMASKAAAKARKAKRTT